MKMIIATYMGILTADGLGTIFETYILPNIPALTLDASTQALVLFKVATFIIVVLLLVVKGGFKVDMLLESSVITRLLSTAIFGFLNAGLIMSTLLIYLTGGGFVTGTQNIILTTSLYAESELVRIMVNNYSVWFAIPAVAIVLISFMEIKND